jgi:hypothetical protein
LAGFVTGALAKLATDVKLMLATELGGMSMSPRLVPRRGSAARSRRGTR